MSVLGVCASGPEIAISRTAASAIVFPGLAHLGEAHPAGFGVSLSATVQCQQRSRARMGHQVLTG